MCKGEDLDSGKTTVKVQREETLVIIKDVPADVCEDCGEYYLEETVARKVYAQAEEALKRHNEVEILQYAI